VRMLPALEAASINRFPYSFCRYLKAIVLLWRWLKSVRVLGTHLLPELGQKKRSLRFGSEPVQGLHKSTANISTWSPIESATFCLTLSRRCVQIDYYLIKTPFHFFFGAIFKNSTTTTTTRWLKSIFFSSRSILDDDVKHCAIREGRLCHFRSDLQLNLKLLKKNNNITR
jgi:hypothetical protein